MVRTQCFYFGGPGSIPGLGTKICKLHDVAKNKKRVSLCLCRVTQGTSDGF